MNEIPFYFDFASPYSYIASLELDGISERQRCSFAWRPIMLGAALKISGAQPNIVVPMKGDYMRRELERTAKRKGYAFHMPTKAPILSLLEARGYYWLQDTHPEKALPFAKAIWSAYFTRDADITDRATVSRIASEIGVDGTDLIAATADPGIKKRLTDVTNGAVEAGVFGAPFFVVNGEQFWGYDRLADLEAWLETGGW